MSGFIQHSKRLGRQLSRRKIFHDDGPQLARVLNLYDLTALGVGSTLGLGVYVLTGQVARHIAGPAVGVCFAVAALGSLLAGLCYAEFASRVPRAGSAYIYSFVTMGELVAFTIGWTLVLEYMVGTASVARGLTCYVDELVDHQISDALGHLMPVRLSFLSEYLDIMSFSMIVLLTCLLVVGAKESTWLNNIFTIINLITIAVVIGAGCTKVDGANWARTGSEVPPGAGVGGFLPYGVAGVMVGSAKCFYGFIGFDCIATTGEEAINPKRDIPIGILYSLLIVFCAYLGMSVVLTLMMPYYDINPLAPLTDAFDYVNMYEIKWCITVGSLSALCTALLGAMFPLPRILYAMAQDGLMFRCFARVHHWTQTPITATIVSGLMAATIAMIFNLDQLIELGTIGVMLAYTIVAMGVVVMHYQDDRSNVDYEMEVSFKSVMGRIFTYPRETESNTLTACFARSVLFIYLGLCIIECAVVNFMRLDSWLGGSLCGSLAVLIALCVLIIALQPKSTDYPIFKVPLVPFIPCLSILLNTFLMFQLMGFTWIGFVVWMIVGYFIYFGLIVKRFLAHRLTRKLAREVISGFKFLV